VIANLNYNVVADRHPDTMPITTAGAGTGPARRPSTWIRSRPAWTTIMLIFTNTLQASTTAPAGRHDPKDRRQRTVDHHHAHALSRSGP